MDYEKLTNAMAELDEETVYGILRDMMAGDGNGAMDALAACQNGLQKVGDLFASGEYFVSDLIFAGEVMCEAMNIIKPALLAGSGGAKGRVILCTVQGDLHDIGKNIVRTMLEAGGFEVLDLGIDVPPAKIVETAKRDGIYIIALSGVLTLAIDSMKKTVDAFAEAGMRESVKIIIGGAPVTEEACCRVTADAWAETPMETVKICSDWSAGIK